VFLLCFCYLRELKVWELKVWELKVD